MATVWHPYKLSSLTGSGSLLAFVLHSFHLHCKGWHYLPTCESALQHVKRVPFCLQWSWEPRNHVEAYSKTTCRGCWCWIDEGRGAISLKSALDTSQLSKHCEGRQKNRHDLHTFYFCSVRIIEVEGLVEGIADLFNYAGAIGWEAQHKRPTITAFLY